MVVGDLGGDNLEPGGGLLDGPIQQLAHVVHVEVELGGEHEHQVHQLLRAPLGDLLVGDCLGAEKRSDKCLNLYLDHKLQTSSLFIINDSDARC